MLFPYVREREKLPFLPLPFGSRQLPTLPSRSQLSTISVWRLNFCVRYGYRWCPPAIVTGNFPSGRSPSLIVRFASLSSLSLRVLSAWLAPLPRTFKTAQVRVDQQTFTLLRLSLAFPRALSASAAFTLALARSLLFFRSSPRPISIAKLHASQRFHRRPIYLIVSEGSYLLKAVAVFFFRGASRLDAFSVYPVRTSLPSCAFGKTTVAPEVRPSRSSRTRDSSRHDSCAHDG